MFSNLTCFLDTNPKDCARIIRWDRGGAVVTAPVVYHQNLCLFDFLVRYNNASKEIRGHDLTVSLSTPEGEAKARMFIESDNAKQLLKMTVQPSGSDPSYYIVPIPSARPVIPVGCWTRTS